MSDEVAKGRPHYAGLLGLLALATILPAACRHACHDYAAPARRGCGTLAGPPSAPKTEREKNLEKDLEKATDPTQRRKMSEELDALRRDRQRENARNQTEAAQAKQTKDANIRQRRLEGGSRFNLRYKPVVPSEALTPDGVMQALAEYVDFAPIVGERAPEPAARAASPHGDLRKGLTVDEVDALLGRPDAITQRTEGALKVSTSTYHTRERAVTAEFVEGVLIRFTITSP